jgi:CubicO group peptidase (beta-lactamase class C family)
MVVRTLVFLLVLSLGQGCRPSRPAASERLADRVDAYVMPFVRSNNFSGAILIAKNREVLFRKAYGFANVELQVPNTPETRFHVASVSKSWTAAAIILLEERGLLRTSDILSDYISDYPEGGRITIHNLLVHTSGIPNVNNFPDYDANSCSPHSLEEIIGWFKDRPLEFEPGSRYSYSNSNYNLLAFIIEKVSGMSYGDFLKANIFDSLGMIDTAHDGDEAAIILRKAYGYVPARALDLEAAPPIVWSVKTGNGSIMTTVDDLSKWDRALYGDGILSEESRRKIFTDHIDGVGYGWFIRSGQRRSVVINGRAPGFSASLERFVDDGVCIAMASNLYSSLTHTMADDLAAIVFGEPKTAPFPPKPIIIPPEVLGTYCGSYRFGEDFSFNPGMRAEVRIEEGGLVLVSGGGGGASYLIPLGENRFIDRLYGGVVSFEKAADGPAPHLVWNFGQDYRAERIGRQ